MNAIFYAIVLIAVVFAGITDSAEAVGDAALASAKASVELALSLVGAISLFLGLMAVVDAAGGLDAMARLIRPLLVRLFPDVPADHPAMGAMVMNLSANVVGLGNAATPFGLKAMKELDELNEEKGTATDAMVLFLTINTGGVAVLPTGMMAIRASLGSEDPAAIFPTTLLATSMATLTGVTLALFLNALMPRKSGEGHDLGKALRRALSTVGFLLALVLSALVLAVAGAQLCGLLMGPLGAAGVPVGVALTAVGALGLRQVLPSSLRELSGVVMFGAALVGVMAGVKIYGKEASVWILPVLILGMLTLGVARKVKVYEVFIKGAKEGFTMALTIIPYLVAILVSVGMLRASGGLERIVGVFSPFTEPLGMPGEVLPLGFLRSLTGSGASAFTMDLLKTHGPDSYIGQLASTVNGSSETTFYVLAVYFGSVGITRTRGAVAAGLAADVAGVIFSVLAVKALLGS